MREKLCFKQAAKIIKYQKEHAKKEEEVVMLRKRTNALQLELTQHYNIYATEKTEKEKMMHELNVKQETINKLQANMTIYEADVKKLTQQLEHQAIEVEKLKISRQTDETNEMQIMIKKMQEKIDDIHTTEIKLSKLNDQLKNQREELRNKDRVIQTLQMKIESYKFRVNDNRATSMGQLNVNDKMLKSTVMKETNARAIVSATSKVAGLIRRKFLSEKKLTSKQFCNLYS